MPKNSMVLIGSKLAPTLEDEVKGSPSPHFATNVIFYEDKGISTRKKFDNLKRL